jgi:hypothetical protein
LAAFAGKRVGSFYSGAMPRLIVLLLLLSTACFWCLKPWQRYHMPRRPDRSSFEPGTHGWELFIWDCIGNQHVVIGQYTTEMFCQNPVKEVSACGTQTPLEAQHGANARSDSRWPK